MRPTTAPTREGRGGRDLQTAAGEGVADVREAVRVRRATDIEAAIAAQAARHLSGDDEQVEVAGCARLGEDDVRVAANARVAVRQHHGGVAVGEARPDVEREGSARG